MERASQVHEKRGEEDVKLREEISGLGTELDKWRGEMAKLTKVASLLKAQRELKSREASRARKLAKDTSDGIMVRPPHALRGRGRSRARVGIGRSSD